ncbi:glycosyltransferase [Paraburkholderia caledonica]|jgi:ceramide glucosyltransferase|uniref:glycosyltransferase n=1 Tax=Paraburkholderia caledonica TaxID=134536 RepID=UPI003CC5CABD
MTDYHFLPGVVTGLSIGRARPCFGQTIAMTRTTLMRLGGLAQFGHHVAEDYAIGEAMRRSGFSVVMHPFPLALLAALTSWGNLLACWLVVLTLMVRAILVWQTDCATGERCRGFPWLPLWDVLQFVIYVASFFSSRVLWRGQRFDVDENGLLSPCVQHDSTLKRPTSRP